MSKPVYWVAHCIIVDDPVTGKPRPALRKDFLGAERAKLDEACAAGQLAITTDGEVCQPLESFADQVKAEEHARGLQGRHARDRFIVFAVVDL